MHFSSFLQTLSLLSLLSGSPAAAQAPGVDPASVNQECNHQGLVNIISPVTEPQTFAINQTVPITWTFENTTSSLFNIGIGDSSSGNFATFAYSIQANTTPGVSTTYNYMIASTIEGVTLATDDTTEYAFQVMEATDAQCGDSPIAAYATSANFVLVANKTMLKGKKGAYAAAAGRVQLDRGTVAFMTGLLLLAVWVAG